MRLLNLLPLVPFALADLPPGKNFWWTALGDSYASGVGADYYIGGQRCLRYAQAYPQRIQKYTDLGNSNMVKRAFQNCVCSGAEIPDVEKYQLLDKDTSAIPNAQYGERPRFGEPSMATLHVGGDDIDFPGILLNCILESHVPGGPPTRTCDDQRDHSWSLIKSDNLWKNFGNLIGKIVDKGRKGPVGDKFRLYVIGYGQFFNDKTTACDNVTFARTANPKDDGKKHTMITTNLRQDFNKMSLALNDAISRAVGDYKDKGVTFLDIDHFLEGHRFCEEGINEPDQNNEKLYFFHYPYKQNDKAAAPTNQSNFDDIVNAANEKVFGNSSTADLSKKYVNAKAVDDAFYDALDYGAIEKVTEGNVSAFWGYFIGDRAKVFHPQEVFHDRIEWMIYDRYKEDGGVEAPKQWSYGFQSYTGKVDEGKFAFFVLPGRFDGKYDKRRFSTPTKISNVISPSSIVRRIMRPPLAATPLITKHPGKVHVWTQDGDTDKAAYWGPFDLDCTRPQDEWQTYVRGEIGLKWDLQIQSGHACADRSSDFNMDNLHARYGSQNIDIPEGHGAGKCDYHDNGVSCNSFHT